MLLPLRRKMSLPRRKLVRDGLISLCRESKSSFLLTLVDLILTQLAFCMVDEEKGGFGRKAVTCNSLVVWDQKSLVPGFRWPACLCRRTRGVPIVKAFCKILFGFVHGTEETVATCLLKSRPSFFVGFNLCFICWKGLLSAQQIKK